MAVKIVVLDGNAVHPEQGGWDFLNVYGEVTVYPYDVPEDLLLRCKDADIALTNKVVFTQESLAQLPKLKLIAVVATGYNVVDCTAARAQGITVCNVPAYSTDSVAQMTWAHILQITNRVGYYAQCNREGRWSKSPNFCYCDFPIPELAGKTLGIVGMGNIGERVAAIAQAFGMYVVAVTHRNQETLPQNVTKVSISELCKQVNIISLHCPLTQENQHFVNEDFLRKLRPSTIIINTGRGALVDECAVAEALAEGRLAAYAADVLEQEPPKADNPLLHAPNAFLTPHIAWASVEAKQRLQDTLENNIRAFLAGKPINVVN